MTNPEFDSWIVYNMACLSRIAHVSRDSKVFRGTNTSEGTAIDSRESTLSIRDIVCFYKRYGRWYNFRVRSRGSREWREKPPRAGYRPGLRPVPCSPRVRFPFLPLPRCSICEKHPAGDIRTMIVIYFNVIYNSSVRRRSSAVINRIRWKISRIYLLH